MVINIIIIRKGSSCRGMAFYLKNPTPPVVIKGGEGGIMGGGRESDGTGMLCQEPNPTGSRPTDLIGLCGPTKKERQGGQGKPNRRKGAAGKGGGGNLFKRATERLYLRPPIHGTGGSTGIRRQIRQSHIVDIRDPGSG